MATTRCSWLLKKFPARKVNKPETGHFSKAGVAPYRVLREFRQMEGDFEVGQLFDVSQFEVGQQVKVTGHLTGKGFAGVVKRYGFRGKNSTHGTPDRVRHGGSIGQGTTPGKVWKGKKMSGQMGNAQVSTKGLNIVRIDSERNLLFISDLVPGAANGFVDGW